MSLALPDSSDLTRNPVEEGVQRRGCGRSRIGKADHIQSLLETTGNASDAWEVNTWETSRLFSVGQRVKLESKGRSYQRKYLSGLSTSQCFLNCNLQSICELCDQ